MSEDMAQCYLIDSKRNDPESNKHTHKTSKKEAKVSFFWARLASVDPLDFISALV